MASPLAFARRVMANVGSVGDLWLLVRVAVVMAALPVLLRLRLPRTLAALDMMAAALGPAGWAQEALAVRYVDAIARRHRWSFQDNCLARALTLYALLNRPATPIDLVFGVHEVRRPGGTPVPGRRHVWMERNGAPYLEHEPVHEYVQVLRHPARRVLAAELEAADDSPSGELWMAMGIGGLASGLVLVASIVRAKIVALGMGPEGLGVLGQLAGVAVTAAYVATFGTSTGVARYLSEAFAAKDDRRAIQVVTTALHIMFWPAVAVVIILAAMASPLAWWALGDPSKAGWVVWLLPCVPLTAAASLASAVLRASRQYKRLAAAQILAAVAGVGATWAIVAVGSLESLALLPAVLLSLQAAASVAAAWCQVVRRISLGRDSWDWATARAIAGYGAATIATAAISTVVYLAMGRSFLARQRPVDAGEFRALQMMSEGVFAVLMGGYHAYFYPTLCRVTVAAEAERVLARMLRSVALAALPLMAMLSVGAPVVVPLLYSSSFSSIVPLLRLQVAGDFLRAIHTLLGLPLLARGRLGLLVGLQALWGVLCLAIFAWQGPEAGPRAFVVAFVASSGAYAAVQAVTIRRALGFRLRPPEAVLATMGTLALVLLASLI